MSELLRPAIEDPELQKILSILGAESKLALVGGCVRDLLGSMLNIDVDLATVLRPEVVKEKLEKSGIRVVETGIEHGTVLAVIEKKHYEITTFRVPGPRQGSEFSQNIETDLSGRDFTINAIAYDLIEKVLVDPYGGYDDLEAGILRAVGDPALRFIEDPLRILRMVRFGDAAGRTVDQATIEAAVLHREKLRTVSVERIRDEIERILLSPFAAEGFRALAQRDLLEFTIPELMITIGVEQNDFHVHDVFEHTLEVINNAPFDRILRLVALFHDIGKVATLTIDDDGTRHFYLHEKESVRIAKEVMSRLRYSHDDIETVSLLVDTHMRPLQCGPQGVRRLMRELGDQLERWFAFKHADKPPKGVPGEFEKGVENFQRLLEEEKNRTVGSVYAALAVRGDDILSIGVPKGPQVGAILKQLHEEVLDVPERNTREYLLERAQILLQTLAIK